MSNRPSCTDGHLNLKFVIFYFDAISCEHRKIMQKSFTNPLPNTARYKKDIKKQHRFSCAVFYNLAEWTGLEPATPGVTGRYSNQLNYHSAQKTGG